MRRGAFIAATAITASFIGVPVAHAATTSPYVWTQYRNPVSGATKTVITPLSFYTPMFIDADRDVRTGDQLLFRGADLRIRITPTPLVALLQLENVVERLDTSKPLPLKMKVVYPYDSSGHVFEYGFDLRHADLPGSLTLNFNTAGVSSSLGATLNQTGITNFPNAAAMLFGEVYREDALGNHEDATFASLTLTPAPQTFTVNMSPTLLESGDGSITLASNPPAKLDVAATQIGGVYTETYALTIDKVPSSLSLSSTTEANGDRVISYTAAAPLDGLSFEHLKALPERRVERMSLNVAGMPTSLSVRSAADGSTNATASSAIGMLRFAMAEALAPGYNADPWYLPNSDYAYLAEIPGAFDSVAVQIHGLTEVKVAQAANGIDVILDAARVPFHARMWTNNDRYFTLDIDQLPDRLQITGDFDQQLTWTASDPIGRLDILGYDVNGFGSEYNTLRARIDGLPTNVTLNLAGNNGAVGFDAGGQTIGLLDVVLSRDFYEVRPWDVWVTGDPVAGQNHPVNGILLWDRAGMPPVLAARFPGLKSVSASVVPGGTNTVSIRSNGLPRLAVEIWQEQEYLFADLQGLDPVVDVTMAPYGAGQRITYDAGSAQSLLRMSTGRFDGGEWMWGNLGYPLPAHMDIRTGVDEQNKLWFNSDQRTTINFADHTGNSATNAWLSHLRVGSGNQWFELDTDWQDMGGDFRANGMRLDIRNWLRAQDYRFSWSECFGVPCWFSTSGGLDCDNTYVTASGITFNAEDIAC
jgi:hypothetical protein